MGEYLRKGLDTCKERLRSIKEVRGLGLLQGMELNVDAKAVVADCLTRGVLINSPGERVLRFVPPLIISQAEIDRLLDALAQIFSGKQLLPINQEARMSRRPTQRPRSAVSVKISWNSVLSIPS